MKLHTVCIAPGFSLQLIWFDLSNQKQIGPSCGRGGWNMNTCHKNMNMNIQT